MNLYSFRNYFGDQYNHVKVEEERLEAYLSWNELLEGKNLDIGEIYIDEDGFIWRRDA